VIKLKHLLKESLKDMVFSKTIKPKHKKKMNRKLELFSENANLTITPPPSNDGNKTKAQLHHLLAYNEGIIDGKMVEQYDDLVDSYMPAIKKNNIDMSEDDIQQIADEGAKYTLKLKYKFNRPRPYQIAEHYGIEDFKIHKLDSAKTPSYPSGHAMQGRLIALMLVDKDPEHQNEYMAISQKISESRIMARAHFPSDTEYGEKLADELYEQRIK
jgi:hypothetical protein